MMSNIYLHTQEGADGKLINLDDEFKRKKFFLKFTRIPQIGSRN
jgi:hypothetical protein